MFDDTFEDKLERIPIIKYIYRFLKGIKFNRTMNGLSLYGLLKMYILGIFEGAFTYHASSIAFSFFTSIFPFTLFVLNLIPFIPIDGFDRELLIIAQDVVPSMAYHDIDMIIHDIMSNSQSKLLWWGFFLCILLMSSGINAILESFASSRHILNKEGFFKQYLKAIIISLGFVFLLMFSIFFIIGLNIFTRSIGLHEDVIFGFSIVRSIKLVFLLLMLFIGVSILFTFGVSRSHRPAFFNAGSVLTSVLYIITSYIFGFWAEHFSTYNKFYGSIGTLLLVMLYIWLNSIILLLGFELNSIIKSHTIKSSKSIIVKITLLMRKLLRMIKSR